MRQLWPSAVTASKPAQIVLAEVDTPMWLAHRNPMQMARRLKAVLMNELDALEQLPIEDLLQRRYQRLRAYGAYEAA